MEYEYKNEYPNSRVLKFEANLLPPGLRPLGILVKRCGIRCANRLESILYRSELVGIRISKKLE
jgi:hypothetical protein